MSVIDEPPQGSAERRGSARVPLFALLDVTAEVFVLTVRNLSLSGVLVDDDGHDLSRLSVGTKHELAIFTPGDTERQLVLAGEVVRHELGGMALRWTKDSAAMVNLVAWLDR
jgi:hypothetical protein